MKDYTKKRTNWDWSKHTHKVEIFKSSEGNEIRVDHFQKGDSNCGYVKFVNDSRGMSVFGDFGNWIFCRQFHPSADGFVSEGYWFEKLRMKSCQELGSFDEGETDKELQELLDERINELTEEYEGVEDGPAIVDDKIGELKEWVQIMKSHTGDEIEYKYNAFRMPLPEGVDHEDIPFAKKVHSQLPFVFDAFDEICRRLRSEDKIV